MWWRWGRVNWRRRRQFWLICTKQICNVINYNVIFIDEIHFNVMIMMLIYYWMIRKYLFYYCDMNWCYCVLCATMNLSIWKIDRSIIQIQSDIRHCFTPMKTLTECVHRYISVVMRIVSFLHDIIHGVIYTWILNEMFPSVYSSSDENCLFFKALFTSQCADN